MASHLGPIGGSEIAQLRILGGLAEAGWDVHVLYVSAGGHESEWKGFTADMVPIRAALPSRSHPVASTVETLQAALAGARTPTSVVYVHNAGDVPLAKLIGTMTRRPAVAHLHLPPPNRQPLWLNSAIRSSAAVIAPSSDAARRWIDETGVRSEKVSVIPTGVDLEHFRPLDRRARLKARRGIGVEDDEPMILYAGRLEWNKGAHVLLEAAEQLLTPVHVVLCGATNDVGYRASLRPIRSGRVTMLGPRPDVATLMGAADLVVLPSIVAETQGLVISEAMASGTPVLACDVGGVSESMRAFPDQLVPPNDARRLAEAIGRYLPWRTDRPQLGRQSRAWVVREMPLAGSIGAIDEVLSRL